MDYLTIKEAAKLWNTTEQMLRRYCREGRIPGAIQRADLWLIPEDAEKPSKKLRTKPEAPAVPPFVKQLQRQRTRRIHHGLYDYLQIHFCYCSNRLASIRLMEKQVEELFTTRKVSTGFEPIRADDIIEAINHFGCLDHIINTAAERVTQSYIRKLHTMLGYGTLAERKGTFRSGEYRKDARTLGSTRAPAPKNINAQMSELLSEYERISKVELVHILDFHVRFERISPFEDGNGRIGRLLMLKECLRHQITPFIIDDKHRTVYLKGIREWDLDRTTLFNTCQKAQERFTAKIELEKLMAARTVI